MFLNVSSLTYTAPILVLNKLHDVPQYEHLHLLRQLRRERNNLLHNVITEDVSGQGEEVGETVGGYLGEEGRRRVRKVALDEAGAVLVEGELHQVRTDAGVREGRYGAVRKRGGGLGVFRSVPVLGRERRK